MREKHPLAGKKVRLKVTKLDPMGKVNDLAEFEIEDWWENVSDKPWGACDGNPACMFYGLRARFSGLPPDNNVIYGKIGAFGNIVHQSELGELCEK